MAIKVLLGPPALNSSNGVESVTGDGVDNADPKNPILSYPTPSDIGAVKTDTDGEPVGSDVVLNVVSLTQAEYDTGTPIATTFYLITDA